MNRTLVATLLSSLVALAACGEQEQRHHDVDEGLLVVHEHAIEAYCTANVIDDDGGTYSVPVESDYLPQVVACENGGADFEALKAQAVSARTYLYFKMEVYGEIYPDTRDQAYECGRPARQEHYDAVEATSGQILTHNDIILAAFYVAGAIPSTENCVPAPGDNDPTSTERWVTYNEGATGDDVQPTPLGSTSNPRNRGCKSQNGAHCMAEQGKNHDEILRFYYGADVVIEAAEGTCVDGPGPGPTCDIAIAGSETVIDDSTGCFVNECLGNEAWWEHPDGEGSGSVTTYTIDGEADCTGTWNLDVHAAGTYDVDVHIPRPAGVLLSEQAPYRIRHAGIDSRATIDQRSANGWVSLGSFYFDTQPGQFIALSDNTGEPYTDSDGVRVIFDAVRLRPAGANNDPGNNGTTNNGTTNNGTTNNGTTNNGTANNGPGNNGTANNGPGNNGTANNGPGNNGTTNNGGFANNGQPGTNNGTGQPADGTGQTRVTEFSEGCHQMPGLLSPNRPFPTLTFAAALTAALLLLRRRRT